MYDFAFEASCQLAKTLYAGYDQLAKIIFGGLGSLWFLPNVLETIVLVLGNVKDVPFTNILWLKLDPCDVNCGLRELCLG